MKITKELLEHLKVNSFSLEKDGRDILCHLDRVEKGLWTFTLPNAQNLRIGEIAEVTVLFEREEMTSVLYAEIKDFGENWICVCPEENAATDRLSAFYKIIRDMEEKYETFGRRKENRIKIGKENARKFGLSKLEQEIFLQGVKLLQPCVVLDASVHGICVITLETPFIKKEETFCIRLSFQNPEQTVILRAHKVYSRLSKTEQKTFTTLSCQLLEPIHFAWKDRVIAMISENEA